MTSFFLIAAILIGRTEHSIRGQLDGTHTQRGRADRAAVVLVSVGRAGEQRRGAANGTRGGCGRLPRIRLAGSFAMVTHASAATSTPKKQQTVSLVSLDSIRDHNRLNPPVCERFASESSREEIVEVKTTKQKEHKPPHSVCVYVCVCMCVCGVHWLCTPLTVETSLDISELINERVSLNQFAAFAGRWMVDGGGGDCFLGVVRLFSVCVNYPLSNTHSNTLTVKICPAKHDQYTCA